MKRNLLWLLLVGVALAGIGAAVNLSTSNLYIQNDEVAEVKIRVRTAAAQTAPWMEFNSAGTLAFSLPATGIVPVAYGGTGGATAAAARTALGIQSGTNIFSSDSRVTNTFATAFTVEPFVTLTRFVIGTVTNGVLVSVSTTNLIEWGQTNALLHWIAVGTP